MQGQSIQSIQSIQLAGAMSKPCQRQGFMRHTVHDANYAAFRLHVSGMVAGPSLPAQKGLGAFLLLRGLGMFSPEQVSTAEKNTRESDGPVTRQGCNESNGFGCASLGFTRREWPQLPMPTVKSLQKLGRFLREGAPQEQAEGGGQPGHTIRSGAPCCCQGLRIEG